MKLDPIDAFLGVGVGLIARVLAFFASGWVGVLVGEICASYNHPSDLLETFTILQAIFMEMGAFEILKFLFWPVLSIWFIAVIPLYGAPVALILTVASVRLLFTEDAPLFWALLILLLVSLGIVILSATWLPFVIFGFFAFG
ncbi:MAG: hypothetical protein AAF226_19535, partial [Verrucomicrobiota bacterium]